MAIAKNAIRIYRGDTFSFSIAVTNYDDTVFDLTDYTLTFTARVGLTGTAIISEDFACTTDPALGVAYGVLSSAMTDLDIKKFQYDIQIANTDDPKLVYTIARGQLTILRDLTT